MASDTLLILMPVVEACVAAAIALLLYRTSNAFVQGDSIAGIPVKGVRFAGSAAIFVVALLAMVSANPRGDVLTRKVDAKAMRDTIGRIEDGAAKLSSCYKLDPADKGCADHVEAIVREANNLKKQMPIDSPPS